MEIRASLARNPLKSAGVDLGKARGLGRGDVSFQVGGQPSMSIEESQPIRSRLLRTFEEILLHFQSGFPTQVNLGRSMHFLD